jgi:Na+/melibiose symporter-like transporter
MMIEASALELGFVLITVATGAVNLLFSTFHIELFRAYYGLDATSFAATHAVYAIWNTANDLGSGWVADRLAVRAGSRVPVVRTAALLWVTVGFLFPWFRWVVLPLPLQFLVALSLFDALYSFVAVVEGALLAELITDTAGRARVGRLTSMISMVVFPLLSRAAFAYWDLADLNPFRRFACMVSCAAASGVLVGARLLQRGSVYSGRPMSGSAGRYGQLPKAAGVSACAT